MLQIYYVTWPNKANINHLHFDFLFDYKIGKRVTILVQWKLGKILKCKRVTVRANIKKISLKSMMGIKVRPSQERKC